MKCNCCEDGFENSEQAPEDMFQRYLESKDPAELLAWIANNETDLQICDCCGDGECDFYGIPGYHYIGGDFQGQCGPYQTNGGSAKCH